MRLQEVVADQLRRHEGLRLKPYHCTAGKLTIGYGRNLENRGISTKEAEFMLNNDIEDAMGAARSLIISFDELSVNRQAVLVNMIFNLGVGGLSGFHTMLAAIDNKLWKCAADAMRQSKWYVQVKGRAEELAQLMERG